MKLSDGAVEVILDILGIEGEISPNGWMMAKCPLHGDNNPSLAINVHGGGGWKCFSGCGTGSLIEMATRLGMGMNPEVLAAFNDFDPVVIERTDDDVTRMLIALEKREPPNEANLLSYLGYCDYLKDRGISSEAAHVFGISYDPERRRIVIPIRDHRGRLMGAEARTIDPAEHGSRYTAMWRCDKSNWVWGAWAHHPLSPLLVLEGALGAARAKSMGAKAPVATLGASASEGQLVRLGQAPFVAIAFDPDAAGMRGAVKVANELIVTEHAIIELPSDIDDISTAAFRDVVNESVPRWAGHLLES